MEEKNINILIAEFEQNLEQLLSTSNLPIGVAYYILKAQTDKLQNNYIGFINSYYMQQNKETPIEEENNEVE